ncbi:MAG: hypothetical protein KGQ36_06480 [Rickettsiales bacterium]|nr:hypothetical protein [Rickettsiales bacterium]
MTRNAQIRELKRTSSDEILEIILLTIKDKTNEAKALITKINLEELADEDHHELSWTIANNRSDGGENDSSHIVIQHLIESGFKIEAIKETKDENGRVIEEQIL